MRLQTAVARLTMEIPPPLIEEPLIDQGRSSQLGGLGLGLVVQGNYITERSHQLQQIIHNKEVLLKEEMAAVCIQCALRRCSATKRVELVRLRTQWMNQFAKVLMFSFQDEVAIESAVNIGKEIAELHNDSLEAQEQTIQYIKVVIHLLINDVTRQLIREVVMDTIKSSTSQYLENRPKHTTNPIVAIITALLEEAIGGLIPVLIRDAIKEKTNDYFHKLHAEFILTRLAKELIEDMKDTFISETKDEFIVEDALEQMMIEVIVAEAKETAEEILNEVKVEMILMQRAEDLKVIGEVFMRRIGVRLVASRLLMFLQDNFDCFLMEFNAKEVVKRMIAGRLSNIINCAAESMEFNRKSILGQSISNALLLPIVRDALITELLLQTSTDVDSIELLEKEIENP